ncbi:restriction endonuclease subunit S [Aequorivita echinoideorum]|uniref:Restriction endonuclease subunit S n=1 Tax=Aequorivita echinoideorum TaxID=1549647 RepID=A0ABS5S2Z1_9FLAO|nr:restriction endonuclease subunit S [Aequorivita echinoideorum]MBT0606825.1 restriction endonuclease subunit S [Aequorivita echinoideorum]
MKDKLPKDWKWSLIGNHCKTTSGGTPNRGISSFWNGNIAWLKSGELNDGLITSNSEFISQDGLKNSSAKIFPKGTLLLALYGATAGRLGYLNFESATNQAVCAIFPNENELIKEYIFHYLKLKRGQIINDSFGGAQPNISQTYIRNFSIPLPPFPEQQAIVQVLEATFDKIDQAISLVEKNIQKIQELNESVLDEVFEYSTFEKVILKNVVINTPQINPKLKPKDKFTYIDISAIDNSIQKITNPNSFIGKNAPSRAKKQIQKGDILFSTTRPKNKNIAKVEEDYENPIATTGFSVLRASEIIDKNYLFHFVTSDNIQAQIEPFIRGAQYPAISDKNILETKIPFPNITEQKKIAKYLDDITEKNSRLIKHYQNKLHSLQDLKKSVLDSAFKGKLKHEVAEIENSTVLDSLFPDLDAYSEVANLQQAIIVLKTKQTFGSGRGKVYLQKTSANIQKVEDVDIPYEFNMSHHGDFSWKLSEDLDKNPYLIKISTEYGDVFEIRKEKKKEVSEAIKSDKYSKFANAVKEMLAVYKDDLIEGVTDRVELLNTVMRAMKETNSIIGNTIYKFMGDWKISQNGYNTKADKFNPHETFAMIGLVRRLGWDKKLIE